MLAGTAFTGAFIAVIAAFPQGALAACAGVDSASVSCDLANQAAAGTLATTFNGSTVVNVGNGGKIDAGGATATVTAPGDLTFHNNDATYGIRNLGFGAGTAVTLTNDFGNITYVGNANVTATGGVTGDGIHAEINAGAGNISITNNSTVSGTDGGIFADNQGSGSVLVTGTGAVNGSVGIWAQQTGVGPGAGTNGVAIIGSGTVAGSFGAGIGGIVAGGASNVLVDWSGPVSGSSGSAIFARNDGTGNVVVNGSGSVTAFDPITLMAVDGITARQNNGVVGTNGSVSVGGSGNVSATGTGIDANVIGANNTGNVTVTRTGTVTAAFIGINAAAAGGGNVTVTGTGNVSSSFSVGINAVASGGNGNVVVAPAGTVSAQAPGINASAVGTGNITITISNDVTSSQARGITANVVDGHITLNVQSGTVRGGAAGFLQDGIQAGASGTGGVTLTISAGASVISDQLYGLDVDGHNNLITNHGTIRGFGGVATQRTSLVNAGAIIATGGAAVSFFGVGNTLTMEGPMATLTGQAIASVAGTDTFRFAGAGTNSFDVSQIGGTDWALLDKTGSSNWSLTGTGTYAGPVTVNGGTLSVNGDLTSASSLTVNPGGALGGSGIVGNTAINGGTLAPGNSIGTLTVSGSLTMTAASTYLVQISGPSSDKTVVTGTANLAGKVTVDPLARVAATTTYTILGSTGTTGSFSAAQMANNFARNPRLSYVGNDVLLTLDQGLLLPSLPGNANNNQKKVAAGIDNALIAGGVMPTGFNALFALVGDPLLNALTQAAGETATGSQQSTFNAMNQFMGVMMDPFIAGRGDGATAGGNAPGYADAEALAYAAKKRNPDDALAAIYTKAPPMVPFQQRWSVWAAGFGGSQTTDGNTAAGSNTATSRIYGTAIGADYRFSPFTIAGFSLAGGGTNFSVANNGTGRSDLFQAGAFIRHNIGAAYLSGALAYGWQDVTTDRTVTVAGVDQLRARFNANAWSGRVEGGYRFVAPVIGGIGFTPYAAGQFTTFELPAYAEGVISGANTFALAYSAKSVTDTRSELGLRTDKSFAMQTAILTLRGRLAWAHDFNPDRGIGATFQTLPGASFFVNGAAQAANSALVTASAETRWMNGWSTAATFEGEFSNVTRSYAGKGVVRYAW
ncbi:autotransporter domain-containing protein [Bradyrhizobium sp. LjRoot220]|uniref:autotransporter outer membrane beta-barrel domain-containing protein n=1 Tax=Bradyrhizobium sp. LjRoot220 TaxID=3342284 RepID=UPI003ECEC8E2